MKKNYFLLAFFFLVIMVSCQPSNEKKAMALIDDYMMGYLADYDSYKPEFVKIDTAYNNPLYNKNIVTIVKRINKAQETLKELTREIEWANSDVRSARSSMSIFMDDYYSAFGREQRKIAEEEYNEAKAKLDNLNNKKVEAETIVRESMAELEGAISQIKEGVCGWQITHNYKCRSMGGMQLSSQSVFIVNDDFTQIQQTIHEEDMAEFIEIAETLAEICGIELEY
ncbi:MAG: hypothetical protein IJN45_00345 [Alistipes sp.]|nr:hypothetical protein [Alistipes sp.]